MLRSVSLRDASDTTSEHRASEIERTSDIDESERRGDTT